MNYKIVLGLFAFLGGLAHLLQGLGVVDLIGSLGIAGKYVQIFAGAVIIWSSFMSLRK